VSIKEQAYSRVNEEPIHVKHADLTRSEADSMFKSECPVCDGMLLVARDQRTFELRAEDRCILCGQRFVYDDIEELRKKERGETTGAVVR